jgi:hypothetical protein
MTGPGSLWPHVKWALVDRWSALSGLAGVTVLGYGPLTAEDLNGPHGSREAVWWDDTAATTGDEPLVELGVPVQVNEFLEASIWVQVLGSDSADDRRAVEERCAELLGVIVDNIAASPRPAPPDGWVDVVVTVRAWQWLSGPLQGSAAQAGARVQLTLRIEGVRC